VKKQQGMTLVELLVVIVVLGIVTSIAVPSYRQYMIRANRVDAKAALLKISAAQEEFYLQNNSYTATLGDGGLNLRNRSNFEHYDLAIVNANAQTFVATATPREGQTQDDTCPLFAVDAQGRKFGGKAPINASNNNPDCWGVYD